MNCVYCGQAMKRPNSRKHAKNEATRDHVFPRSGREFQRFTPAQHVRNRVKCCRRCNERKADMHPTEWIDYIQDPVRRASFAVIIENIVITACIAERRRV